MSIWSLEDEYALREQQSLEQARFDAMVASKDVEGLRTMHNRYLNSLDVTTHTPNFNKPVEFEEDKSKHYNPLVAQEGGSHYKDRGIQPIEYSEANNLNACQHSVVKYITRHEDKNGIEDLGKIIHFTFLEALFKYGIEGSTDLKNRVLKMLGEDKENEE